MKNLTDKFIYGLRKTNNDKLFIFWNLFSILEKSNPDFLNQIIYDYKNNENEYWFTLFHKSFRQSDVFDENKISIVIPALTDSEQKERKNLSNWRHEFVKIQTGGTYEPGDYLIDNEYIKTTNRLKDLNKKLNLYKLDRDNPISGHLDSIFYQAIALNDDSLFEYMNNFLFQNVNKKEA